jgi:hypothetical protein
MCAARALFSGPNIRDLRILSVQGKLLVEGVMSTVRRLARGHCLPIDWSSAPPDVVCQWIGQDTLNAGRARRPLAWW